MPSGAKKRKAAKRKNNSHHQQQQVQQEEEQQRESPDSPTNPQPHHEEAKDGYGSCSNHLATSDDEDQSKLESIAAMENPENRKDSGKAPSTAETSLDMEKVSGKVESVERTELPSDNDEKDADESLSAPPPKTEDMETERPPVEEDEPLPEAWDVRVENIDKGRDDGSRDSRERFVPVTVGPTDFAAGQSVPMTEELTQAAEVQAISTDAAVHSPTLPAESEVTAAPLHEDQPRNPLGDARPLRPHSTWWNCCGLLEVFTGSGR